MTIQTEGATPANNVNPKSAATATAGPAPYTHDEVHLIEAKTQALITKTWTNNMEEWAKGVSLDVYHDRERNLASTAFSSEGRLRTWILVPKDKSTFDPENDSEENLAKILAAVETYQRPGIIASAAQITGESDDGLRDVESMSVASVYAPKNYRNYGYGKLMCKLLWDKIGEEGMAFSFLYSDLGPEFYGRLGWTARLSSQIVVSPTTDLPVLTNPDHVTTRAETSHQQANDQSLYEPITDEALQEIMVRDAHLVRETLRAKVQEQKQLLKNESKEKLSLKTFVAVTPEVRCIQWLTARGRFNVKALRSFADPKITQLGLKRTGTDSFVIWHHDFTDDNLFILRWRLDDQRSTKEQDATALTFMKAAQAEAKKWGISKVVFWNADESLAKVLGVEINHREDSLTSLGLFNSEIDTNAIEWIVNEKYSWC
ncbi:hypothetical protein BGW38_003409 [Lunasporangiospora selenospora]|uniref:LYC1 C-terminal domain-containing protein n=1 Tax=Lunasporangiospora selenospora TaxID=979761 RepID=A0A9P6FRH2_9FUNG|nr:hypothetical protein BGW38_003409 [Lunasporangiospora selenospora]